MNKWKIWWGLFFIALAFLTVWAVISNSKCFSFELLKDALKSSSAGWMAAALVSMLGFILFEGLALVCILKAFGFSVKPGRGFLYSSADIYFSAITPSATGGQPASAYFMMKDKIPGPVVTISLLSNLILYTFALAIVGMAGFILKPGIFLDFHLPGRLFIVFGYLILLGLTLIFYLLIAKPRFLEKICTFFLRLGKKLRIVRNEEKLSRRLKESMEEYGKCSDMMAEHKIMFVKAFILNLLQRVSQISVTAFVYLAFGGDPALAPDIWILQSFVAIGTFSVPIPGGMGVADYLMLDGFKSLMGEAQAVNLELTSRGLSFYVCMFISAVTVLAGAIYWMRRGKKNDRNI